MLRLFLGLAALIVTACGQTMSVWDGDGPFINSTDSPVVTKIRNSGALVANCAAHPPVDSWFFARPGMAQSDQKRTNDVISLGKHGTVSGDWICTNPDNSTVTAKMTVRILDPLVAKKSEEVNATPFHPVTFACLEAGEYNATFRWFLNGNRLENSSFLEVAGEHVTIFNFTHIQSGVYMCSADQKDSFGGSESTTRNVTLQHMPYFANEGSLTAKSGMNADNICKPFSVASPEANVFISDTPMCKDFTGFLNFTAKKEHFTTNAFFCCATNVWGTANATIKFSEEPSIPMTKDVTEAPLTPSLSSAVGLHISALFLILITILALF